MGPDDFGNHRIKPPHQRASCLIVMLKRSLNQRACIRIIHVIESASTPLPMTGNGALRLQLCMQIRLCQAHVAGRLQDAESSAVEIGEAQIKICNRCSMRSVINLEAQKSAEGKSERKKIKLM